MANMVNKEAVQKLCAASYLDDYLDCMQNLPNQLQPHLSRIRELDVDKKRLVKQIEQLKTQLALTRGNRGSKDMNESSLSLTGDDGEDSDAKRSATKKDALRRNLAMAMEELGDVAHQKMAAANKMAEIIEYRRRLLDDDLDNLRNCDQADATLFSRDNLNKSRPSRGISAGDSCNSSLAASELRSSRNRNTNSGSDSYGSSGEQDPAASDGGSDSNSVLQSDGEVSEEGSDADGSVRAPENHRRRPVRSRVEVGPGNRKLKQNERNNIKTSVTASSRANKLHRRTRVPERVQSRSVRSAGRAQDVSSRRKREDSFSEMHGGAGSSKVTAASSRVGKSAATQKDAADSVDQEVDEQLYCICKQVSYGEMVGCDNNSCPMQWFHFSCVSLTTKPKGRWYCPNCRGEKPNMKRADLR